jgi:hypothetical protein
MAQGAELGATTPSPGFARAMDVTTRPLALHSPHSGQSPCDSKVPFAGLGSKRPKVDSFANRHQPAVAPDRLAVAPKATDTSGIAKAWRNLRQLGLAEFARAEFANEFVIVRVVEEVLPVRFEDLLDAHDRLGGA